MIKHFTDLNAWKFGHEFVIDIYKITKSFPKTEIYGIISQLRRASLSITANIAEGFSRYYYKDRMRFYYNSRASLSECQSHILLAKDIGYLDGEIADRLFLKTDKIRKIINGLIRATASRVK